VSPLKPRFPRRRRYTDETLVTKLVEELGEARHIVLSGPPRMMEQLIGPKKLKKTGSCRCLLSFLSSLTLNQCVHVFVGELGGLLAKLGLTRKQMWTMW
jgi:NAD(P)H-flavin reductase